VQGTELGRHARKSFGLAQYRGRQVSQGLQKSRILLVESATWLVVGHHQNTPDGITPNRGYGQGCWTTSRSLDDGLLRINNAAR
jgi:hypothetical protein